MNLKNKELYLIKTVKTCTECGNEKPHSEYRQEKKAFDKLSQRCKSCLKAYQRRWYLKNQERQKSDARQYRKKHPLSHFNSHLKREYGITIDDYNYLFEKQKGCCAICKTHQKDLKKKLNVDHCHDSGKVRGLLCNNCNTSIGLVKENIEVLFSAIDYINRFE